ncbi:MAG: hypothetical protein HFG92_13535 [Dorea sp.]|nr:hypothetical protein [Dorea sp.]
MKIYADTEFYRNQYLLGRTPKIPDADFPYWAMLASGEIRQRTFCRIDDLAEVLEEAGMCCCELAEKLYAVESMKDENGMILQSYGNDGETGTYKIDDLSELEVRRGITRIIRKWIGNTGLMYCGVKR